MIEVGIPTEVNLMNSTLKSYDIKLDSKKRFTIRNPQYEYYHVTEKKNGVVILEPRVLKDPFVISKEALDQIDRSMENVKKGIVYGPVKIKKWDKKSSLESQM